MNRSRIEELISKTTDPVQQATLLVLSNFDGALESNTRATEAIAKDLENHREEFKGFSKKVEEHITTDRDMLVSIRAGWWVGLIFLSMVNIVGGWIITRAINANDNQDQVIHSLELTVTRLEREVVELKNAAAMVLQRRQ